MQLRDYQHEGIEAIRDAFRRGVHRPLYTAPTGSGKTILFSHIARATAKGGKSVCLLVHRRELLLQTCAKLEHRHGVISPGFTPRRREMIQVATVQTLVNRLDQYDFDLIVVDEAHHATARTWMKVIDANPGAWVLGVTATPCRMTGKGLGDLFEELILGPSVTDLTDRGYLAPVDVYAPSQIDTSGLKRNMGDFVKRDLAVAADKPTITGNAVAHYRKYADGEPAIAFCVNVQHAEHVAEQFRQAGYRFVRVDGNTPQRERDEAIQGLSTRVFQGITSCELISEGVDVPVVSVGIMLRPTQSTGLWLQQAGRILRPAPGKQRAIILDHAGNTHRHGLPGQDRTWSLEKGSLTNGNGDAGGVQIRQCSQCYYVHLPAPVCPRCGYEYPAEPYQIEEVDGELEKITEAKVAKRREVGRARGLADLEAIERERDYKKGWAWHVWNARQKKKAAVG